MDDATHQTEHNTGLTSAEMGTLWSQYISDKMVICILSYFLEKIEDEQTKSVVAYALSLSLNQVKRIREIFNKENFPIPYGFTEQDVNKDAPRLFSDSLILQYVKNMSILGMASTSVAVGITTRSDVNEFFTDCLASATKLNNWAKDLLLIKGLYVRPPFIPNPDHVDFVTKQHFLTGFLGDRRPLNAIEITHLFNNTQTNIIGRALLIGFTQVAESKEVREILMRGVEMSKKHIELFSSLLIDENIPAAMTWDYGTTDSTDAPFSDKLMLFHTTALIAAGIGNYGAALAASPRRDIGALYYRLFMEVAQYAEDCANMMIKNGWLEQPPLAPDYKALANQGDS
ncbi:DUF3231 family protein [Ammoniphilus sp. YIM 78166]|uniref:DUF3231 family protein n=1 Tax=Ammoniphilus sp. YIM 78166 TaxID=1644106 RepID=UPI00106FBB13|nr:DUF3231 family protein [Ammoniphilus sp. YIM 78166]